MDTPRPSPRTNRTRRVPHPVLIGQTASLTPRPTSCAAPCRSPAAPRAPRAGERGARNLCGSRGAARASARARGTPEGAASDDSREPGSEDPPLEPLEPLGLLEPSASDQCRAAWAAESAPPRRSRTQARGVALLRAVSARDEPGGEGGCRSGGGAAVCPPEASATASRGTPAGRAGEGRAGGGAACGAGRAAEVSGERLGAVDGVDDMSSYTCAQTTEPAHKARAAPRVRTSRGGAGPPRRAARGGAGARAVAHPAAVISEGGRGRLLRLNRRRGELERAPVRVGRRDGGRRQLFLES